MKGGQLTNFFLVEVKICCLILLFPRKPVSSACEKLMNAPIVSYLRMAVYPLASDDKFLGLLSTTYIPFTLGAPLTMLRNRYFSGPHFPSNAHFHINSSAYC